MEKPHYSKENKLRVKPLKLEVAWQHNCRDHESNHNQYSGSESLLETNITHRYQTAQAMGRTEKPKEEHE